MKNPLRPNECQAVSDGSGAVRRVRQALPRGLRYSTSRSMVLSASFCELKDDLFDAAKAVRVVSLRKNAERASCQSCGAGIQSRREAEVRRQCHPQDGIVTIIGAGKSLGIVMIVGLHGRFQARP